MKVSVVMVKRLRSMTYCRLKESVDDQTGPRRRARGSAPGNQRHLS